MTTQVSEAKAGFVRRQRGRGPSCGQPSAPWRPYALVAAGIRPQYIESPERAGGRNGMLPC